MLLRCRWGVFLKTKYLAVNIYRSRIYTYCIESEQNSVRGLLSPLREMRYVYSLTTRASSGQCDLLVPGPCLFPFNKIYGMFHKITHARIHLVVYVIIPMIISHVFNSDAI